MENGVIQPPPVTEASQKQPCLLQVRNLSVCLRTRGRSVTIIEEVSLELFARRVSAVVGPSGSGKTTLGLALLRLVPPPLAVTGGKIFYQGRNLLALSEEEMVTLRGRDIGMIFQDPLEAFNPLWTIGAQIDEVLVQHTALNRRRRKERIAEVLRYVGLDDPGLMMNRYPHQISGGQLQRAMIAMAIAPNPKIVIADEPTSHLDVTLQARIVDLLQRLVGDLNVALMLITHDMGLVRRMAQDVVVMDHGRVVEKGEAEAVFNNPAHEKTQDLVAAAQ